MQNVNLKFTKGSKGFDFIWPLGINWKFDFQFTLNYFPRIDIANKKY